MGKEIEIPSDYQYTFNRLMRNIPEQYRQDPEFIKEMLAFIKIGGEKLARKNLETYLTPFEKEFVLRRRSTSEDEDLEDDDEKDDQDNDESDTDIDDGDESDD